MTNSYTNKELGDAYFLVVAQNVNGVQKDQCRKDMRDIWASEEDLINYFKKKGNLSQANISRMSKTTKRGKAKRVILERIIAKGPEVVGKEIQEMNIQGDSLSRFYSDNKSIDF